MSEKEALIPRSSVDSSSANPVDDPVSEIQSPLEAMSEKEPLIPRSPVDSSSASPVFDPVSEIPSPLEAQCQVSSETTSTKEPVVFLQSEAQICSFSSSGNPVSVSEGASSTLESSEPVARDNEGGSVGIKRFKYNYYFPSFIKEGTHPSVPLSGKESNESKESKKSKKCSCLKAAGKVFKYLFDKIGFFLMLMIIVIMGTLLSLCYKGHMEDFYLLLTLSLVGLGTLLVVLFALLMLLVYEEMKSKKPVIDSLTDELPTPGTSASVTGARTEDISLTDETPTPGTSGARTEDIRQRHKSGEVQEERL